MNFKRVLMVSMVGAGALASPAAFAGATGNVGVFSEYVFRGIESSSGAAVQGGLDYAADSGLYGGTWVSNTGGAAAAGATEIDLYAGYGFKVGGLGLDFGAIYYVFSEDEEDLDPGADNIPTDADYWEVYAKASISYFAVQVYYTEDYLGDFNEFFADALDKDTDALYVNLLANFPLSETLTLGLQAGFTSGDGAEVAWSADGEDGYEDYSISVTKTLDNGFAMALGIYATSFEEGDGFGTVSFDDDGPKAIISLKKTFEL
ncbi:MAG: TorF family putative porin [Panacagrimonas sp.]